MDITPRAADHLTRIQGSEKGIRVETAYAEKEGNINERVSRQ